MAIVIISCATCFVLGGSIGFLLAAICAMASDKNQHEEGEVKSSVVKRHHHCGTKDERQS